MSSDAASATIPTVYASVGRRLVQYDLDLDAATLAERSSITLPAKVQYVWPHVSGRFLYVATSDGGPGSAGTQHFATALRIDPASGALEPHGDAVALPSRPIHTATDIDSTHLLTAYNTPSNLTVHRINADGTIGALVPQDGLDTGIYAHQVRVAPSNATAILVTRGNNAEPGKPEDPGALKVFDYADGALSRGVSIAPGGGYGFGPRHLDFHPARPWVFVSLERQNALYVHRLDGGVLSEAPVFAASTLAEPEHLRVGQMAGTLHLHPNGKWLYLANRAYATRDVDGHEVAVGGENNIACFVIDEETGEPTLVQTIDTRGYYARTFAIAPGGRLMVVGNMQPLVELDGTTLRTVPANLALFRIGDDGRLDYVRKYDVEVGADSMFWSGIVERAAQ